jgi:hypothetical protein
MPHLPTIEVVLSPFTPTADSGLEWEMLILAIIGLLLVGLAIAPLFGTERPVARY